MIAAATQAWLDFWGDDSGATAIEYAIMAGLIAVVIVAAVRGVGTDVNTRLVNTGEALAPANP